MEDKYPNKKVVYESKSKLISLLIISWSLFLCSILIGYFWGLLFFGICAIVASYPLLDPKKKIIFIGSKEFHDDVEQKFNARLKDPGIFRFSDIGFQLRSNEILYDLKWTEIQAMFGFKQDQFTMDEICLDVFCDGDISFRLTEDTAGWFIFLAKAADQFPSIKKGWEFEISTPAFTTNHTLIYEKNGLHLEEAKAHYYKLEKIDPDQRF